MYVLCVFFIAQYSRKIEVVSIWHISYCLSNCALVETSITSIFVDQQEI